MTQIHQTIHKSTRCITRWQRCAEA